MVALALILIITVLLLCGVSLAYVTGAAAVLAYIFYGKYEYLELEPLLIFSQVDVFALMAMPLFILVGELMNKGGITKALIDFAMSLAGRMKGGLGHVNIITSLFFAGISGSAMADAAALSNTLVPAMKERGYSADYAGAVTAAASIIGPIIPPSIILIFYGAIMGVDVAALFVAGIGPGILLAFSLLALNMFLAHRYNHPGGEQSDQPSFLPAFKNAFPALLLPVAIMAGIIFGVMTPTESAAVAVLLAIAASYVYGALEKDILSQSLKRTVRITGSIFILFVASALVVYFAALIQLPQRISDTVVVMNLTLPFYLLAMTLVFLFIGMTLDTMIGLALVAPLLVPAAIAQGADPVHIGICICLNLAMGMITPPLGGSVMVVSSITRVPYWRLMQALLPFIVVEILVLLLVVYVPEISLFLPKNLGMLK